MSRPLSFADPSSGRQSPFRRQNSASPATTVRASTPTTSPTKSSTSTFSPAKAVVSLSPEKASPFVRRPSQINSQTGERPSSPFARPLRGLAAMSRHEDDGEVQRSRKEEKEDGPSTPTRGQCLPSPGSLDGTAIESPIAATPSKSNLRPATLRTMTASSSTTTTKTTTSTVKPHAPSMPSTPKSQNPTRVPALVGNTLTHLPPALLRSMRESFEVLDTTNTGVLAPDTLITTLEQLSLPYDSASLREYFPPSNPHPLNLARYLDLLSAPMASASDHSELRAAFEAFDVDDSGQIDVAELRAALGDGELDPVVEEFSGKRAFGAKGLNVVNGKGEVFRYREFMASMAGGGVGEELTVG